MANWKTKLKIGDLHAGVENGTLTIQEVARGVADRLSKNQYSKLSEMEEIIEQFQYLSECSESTTDNYDEVLEALYDFGDEGHRIWVETLRFFPKNK